MLYFEYEKKSDFEIEYDHLVNVLRVADTAKWHISLFFYAN